MAKLSKANTEEKVEVTVDTTVTPEVDVNVEETEEKDVEVEEKKEDPEVDLEVDTSPVDIASQATEKTVRIRMRVDHKFNIGTEVYDLKAGSCHNVPYDIKLKLNKAGVLSPL